MPRLAPALILLTALAACQEETSTDVEDDPCGRATYAGLIGTNIAAVTLPGDLRHRVIPPDTAVTMDFVPERLNILTDAEGMILSLRCG